MAQREEHVRAKVPPPVFEELVTLVTDSFKEGDVAAKLVGIDGNQASLRNSAAEAVEELLEISMIDLALKGWKGMTRLRELTGPDGPMDDKARIAALFDHKISAKHRPTLTIDINGVGVRQITFDIEVSLAGKGIALRIRNREIVGISSGRMDGELVGKVEGVKTVETSLGQVDLMKFEPRRDAPHHLRPIP
ncbi:MAG: hypothetical protein AAF871_10220 [Pseudomonadota bacterium]